MTQPKIEGLGPKIEEEGIMEVELPLSPTEYPPFFAHPHANRLLHDPAYFPIRTWSRLPKASSGEDGFFARTVATPDTISHVLTLRRRNPTLEFSALPPPWPAPTADPLTSNPSTLPADIYMLWYLVPPGVGGHPATVHGGMVAACIDEAMSMAVTMYLPPRPRSAADSVSQEGFRSPRSGLYTAQLDVRYKNPVRGPGVTIFRAKVVGRIGRKFWTRCHVLQTDPVNPEQLIVTADAMGFWLDTASRL